MISTMLESHMCIEEGIGIVGCRVTDGPLGLKRFFARAGGLVRDGAMGVNL